MEKKDWLKNLFRPENKKARLNLFTAFVMGVLLLLMSHIFFETPTEKEEEELPKQQVPMEQPQNTAEEQMEKRLENIFKNMEGVGQVDVMLTMKNTTASVLAKEEKKEESSIQEGENKTTQTIKQEYSVVMSEDGKGNRTPLVVQESMPEVEGIVIVAQGGNNAQVVQSLSEASQALLNIPAHKVAVLKMK